MHGRQLLVREIYFGSDGVAVFLRVDFETRPAEMAGCVELHLRFIPKPGAEPATVMVKLESGTANADHAEVKVAMRQLLEIEVPLHAIGGEPGVPVQFAVSMWRGGLPLGTLPYEGWLQVATAEPADWAG
jgi:hypothetical protein